MTEYRFLKLQPSSNSKKKFDALFENKKNNRIKKVSFGSKGMSDYTIHKDIKRKEKYLARHRKREKWGNDGILTAGWWSRWLLWSEPSLVKSTKLVKMKLKNAGYTD